ESVPRRKRNMAEDTYWLQRRGVGRRRLLAGTALTAAGLLACTGSNNNQQRQASTATTAATTAATMASRQPTAPASTATAAASKPPKRGGALALSVSSGAAPEHFDPHQSTRGPITYRDVARVYGRLIRRKRGPEIDAQDYIPEALQAASW